jgi:uncharacterized protein
MNISTSHRKLRIGIDFDDVIFNLSDHLLKFFNDRFQTSFKRDEITAYEMRTLWNLNHEQEEKVIMDFCFSELHHGCLPVKGAIEAIKELSRNHTLIVVTARDDARIEMTHKWLDVYLPTMFDSVIFTNHNHEDAGKRRKKSEVCKEQNIDIFIDDSMGNVLDVSSVVERVFLFDAPWNQGELPENAERVFGWDEILARLSD